MKASIAVPLTLQFISEFWVFALGLDWELIFLFDVSTTSGIH